MSGLLGKAMRFARSSQGKKALGKAQQYVSSPEGKQKIAEVRGRVMGDGKAKPAPGSAVDPARRPKPDPHAPESPR